MAGTRRLSEFRAARRRPRKSGSVGSAPAAAMSQAEEHQARVYAFPTRRSAAALYTEVALLESAFVAERAELLLCLGANECAVDGVEPDARRGIAEQVAFIRVGLRCIADAIGELAAHAEGDTDPAVGGTAPTDASA